MKYLLVLLVVLLVLWLIGSRRRRADKPPAAPPAGTAIIACAHCGLHLPEQEALRDAAGRAYCGEEHRRLGVR